MRAEGSHRVILNTPIKNEIKFGSPSGGPPEGNYLLFMGTVDGKTTLEMLQLKVSPVQARLPLHRRTSS
jgi:Ran-binding protein 3